MTAKSTKITTNLLDMIQLIDENEVKSEMGEAFASFMLNPTVTWAKFVLTDDRKNANGERIPKDEFQNLIRSGIHMPVKMAIGEISPGHPGTKPLGTITHLKEVITEDGTSAIIALAALWGHERPADVEFIKQRFAEKQPVDVSWEILYEDSMFNSEAESMDLLGTVLSAATIVGNPAYTGRTPFLSIAARKKGDAAFETDPEKPAEDDSMDIEKLQTTVSELETKVTDFETKLAEATSQVDVLTTSLAEKDAEIARLTEEIATKENELTPLRELKASIDAENEKKEKLASIRQKFVEAGLEKGDDYFSEHAEVFMKMDDELLSFHIQEALANVAEESKTSTASKKTAKIPALTGIDSEDGDLSDPKVLGRILREKRGNK